MLKKFIGRSIKAGFSLSVMKRIPLLAFPLLINRRILPNQLSFYYSKSTKKPKVEDLKLKILKDNDQIQVMKDTPKKKLKTNLQESFFILGFTCSVCGTRDFRRFSKVAYQEGTVLIKCKGCNNLHLVADNIGICSKEKINIKQIMSNKGQKVKELSLSEYIINQLKN